MAIFLVPLSGLTDPVAIGRRLSELKLLLNHLARAPDADKEFDEAVSEFDCLTARLKKIRHPRTPRRRHP